MGEIQVVLFSLNNELCGIDTLQVQEIVKYQSLQKPDEVPVYADGITDVRGKKIPVVDLNKRFGLGSTEVTKKSKIIISFVNKDFVGFTVNDVIGITKLSHSEIEPPPDIFKKSRNTYLKGVGKSDGKIISILELAKILDGEEV